MTFDPVAYADEVEQAARATGWTVRYLSPTESGPRPWFRRAAPDGYRAPPRLYLSAGIHGDEISGPLALLEMIGQSGFFAAFDVTMFPILNPNGLARGIATVKASVSDAELKALDEAGVRGVRFNFVKRLVDATPRETYVSIAERIAKLGWHIVVYFEAHELADLIPFLNSLPTKIVVDHMGRPDFAKGVDHPDFRRFVDLMAANPKIWSKVTCPERLSISGPPSYDDFVPFAGALVQAFPDRVLWGTDWPHPNMTTHMPDDGDLTNMIPRIAPTPDERQALLVDNPMRLYWSR